jgi:fibronectin-binding autotransporter adhesin
MLGNFLQSRRFPFYFRFLALAVAAILLRTPSVQAANRYWSVTSGNWSTAANWGGTEPIATDIAYIDNGGTATISSAGETCGGLYLGNSNSGNVSMTGGGLTAGVIHVGYSKTGSFTQSAGQVHSSLDLGYNSTGKGTYTLSGSAQLSAFAEVVGEDGTGTFNQSGGVNASLDSVLTLGQESSSHGTYNLSGGQLDMTVAYAGYYGEGIFNQSGGTNSTPALYLASQTISKGVYNLTGGTLAATSINRGSGAATFNFGGGTLAPAGDLTVSFPMTLTGIGGNAIVDSGGHAVSLYQFSGVGGLTKIGAGVLTLGIGSTFTGPVQFNGGLVSTGWLSSLGNGTALVFNGGGLQLTWNFDPSVRTMTFQALGATIDAAASATFANSIGNGGPGGLTKQGLGTLVLSASPNYLGPTVVSAGTLQLGSASILPSTTSVSLTAATAQLIAGGSPQSIASLSGVAGSTLNLGSSSFAVGSHNTSTTFAGKITSTTGGSLTKTGTGTITLTGANTFNGPLNFNAGFVKAAALANLGNGTTFSFDGGGLTFDGVFDPSVRTLTFSAGGAALDTQTNDIVLSHAIGNAGTGGLTKLGSGKLTLNAPISYRGTTILKQGVLTLDGGIDASGSSLIDIQSGTVVLATTAVNKPDLHITAASLTTFEVASGVHTIGDISGGGNTRIDIGATLHANSIQQNSLTIGAAFASAESPFASNPASSPASVPEPASISLLLIAFAALCATRCNGLNSRRRI